VTPTVSKPAISAVRNKGQVWTPRWVADAMAVLLKENLNEGLLDPAIGPGALVAACRDLKPKALEVKAFDIDESVLSLVHSPDGFAKSGIADFTLTSFIEDESDFKVGAVIANPPYLRHHKITPEIKSRCQEIVRSEFGIKIDALAGLHIYFLVKSLGHLTDNGRLVFLLPADTFEGVFAHSLWTAIAKRYKIDGVITMSSDVAAFPGVDTNALIVSISKSTPSDSMTWTCWEGQNGDDFARAVSAAFDNDFDTARNLGLITESVSIETAITRGFTRSQTQPDVEGVPFVQIARAVRGIATGGNDFFAFTRSKIAEYGLDEADFVRTVVRVRDVPGGQLTEEDLEELDRNDRPTFLLSIDSKTKMTDALRAYLQMGVESGLSKGALVSARKNWYFMEKREHVPILFAYLGRRNTRFIRTRCEISPLTGFLCVYPLDGVDVDKLCAALNHPSTILELAKVGKSYGDGAIKVEPGGLRKLVVPFEALEAAGIQVSPHSDPLTLDL
jgi:hypothetical protein